MKDNGSTTSFRPYAPNPIKDLRSGAPPTQVRHYKAIPDGKGDFLRDKAGNLILGEEIQDANDNKANH